MPVHYTNLQDSDPLDTARIATHQNSHISHLAESASNSDSGEARTSPSYIDKGKRPAYSEVLNSPSNGEANSPINQYNRVMATSPVPPPASHTPSEKHFDHEKSYRIAPSTALYLAGVPYQPLGETKRALSKKPICLQARHIRNASWIDGKILELLVDANHAQSMRNRITKYSSYLVRKTFDPLSPESFHWEGNIAPEAQMSLLKNRLAARLGASITSTQHQTTRNHILLWAKHRGIEIQMTKQLAKEGMRVGSESSNITKGYFDPSADKPVDTIIRKSRNIVTKGAKRFSILKRPYSSLDNIQELVNFYA